MTYALNKCSLVQSATQSRHAIRSSCLGSQKSSCGNSDHKEYHNHQFSTTIVVHDLWHPRWCCDWDKVTRKQLKSTKCQQHCLIVHEAASLMSECTTLCLILWGYIRCVSRLRVGNTLGSTPGCHNASGHVQWHMLLKPLTSSVAQISQEIAWHVCGLAPNHSSLKKPHLKWISTNWTLIRQQAPRHCLLRTSSAQPKNQDPAYCTMKKGANESPKTSLRGSERCTP